MPRKTKPVITSNLKKTRAVVSLQTMSISSTVLFEVDDTEIWGDEHIVLQTKLDLCNEIMQSEPHHFVISRKPLEDWEEAMDARE